MEFLREMDSYVWSKGEWGYPLMTSATKDILKQCNELYPVSGSLEIDDVIKKSKAFPIRFPIQAVRLEKLKKKRPAERLKRNINSTYPVVHERVLHLMTHFLIYKRELGSSVEKPFYKDMTVEQLINRIFQKRAISFMYPEDHYKLITGETGEEGWEEVGTTNEKPPLLLENCLSYDEMKLSALMYISGYTECINDGSRHNSGLVSDDIEKEAVIIGLVGPRFERLNRMDYEDIIVTDKQNIPKNGYGERPTPMRFAHVLNKTYKHEDLPLNTPDRVMWRQLWSEFYEVENPTHEELTSSRNIQYKSVDRQYKERFIKLSIAPNCEIFDNEVYFKRLSILVECTLLEAEWRAKERGKDAFVNIVGCGLGVWKISLHQTDVFVLTYLNRIYTFLQRNMLNHVSDFNFSYLRPTQGVLELFNIIMSSDAELPRKMFFESKQHPRGGITVQLDNREPSSVLTGEHEGKLLVLTYPWDGNAQPGNEFWLGYLTGSGDPAAACSTQVAELHNAHINPAVSGRNARVVGRHGVELIKDYCAGLT